MSADIALATPNPAAGIAAAGLLEVRDVVVRYGGVDAVCGMSLDAAPGEIVGLIGPNGAGKSSLLASIGGQHRPSAGKVMFNGRDITRWLPYKRARLGISRTFQMTSEFVGLTVFENLVVAGRGAPGSSLRRVVCTPRANRGAEKRAKADAWRLLETLRFTHAANSYGSELSGGERRIVEILRCMMQKPAILLLDEPTVGVAPHLVPGIVEDLRTIASTGVALVFVEHSLEVVSNLSDRVVVMAEGREIAAGTFDEVAAMREVRLAYLG